MDTKIEKGNIIIEEFTKKYIVYSRRSPEELMYHSDWNFLHSAWDKFRNLTLNWNDQGIKDMYSRHCMAISTAIHAHPIIIAFERLVNGIEWYSATQTNVIKDRLNITIPIEVEDLNKKIAFLLVEAQRDRQEIQRLTRILNLQQEGGAA